MDHSERGIDLRHLAKRRLARSVFESDRHATHIQFEDNFWSTALPAQGKGRTECGMTGKGQLFPYGGGVARKNERSLREVHLLGQGQHFLVGKTAGIRENGERVSFQGAG